MKKTLRVAGYCRTSGEGQRNNTSIPKQRDAIVSLCKNNGWTVYRIYVDESKSGSKVEGRVEFQQMMRDAASGLFDLVIVFDITRFARDGFDILDSSRTLSRDFGVDVLDVKGHFDTRNRRNTLSHFVTAGVSEWERLGIMERTINGRMARAREGRPWAAQPPNGRAYDKTRGKWYVTEKGKMIAELLQRYLDGSSMASLCREYGICRASKVSQWVWETQLAGTYLAHFESAELGINESIPVPAIPEVVPVELLEKVQARLKHNRQFNRRDAKYLFSGFLRCWRCSKAFIGESRKKDGRIYRHKPTDDGCTVKSISADKVEAMVLDYLYQHCLDAPAFNAAVENAMPDPEDRTRLDKQIGQTRKRLAKKRKEVNRLVDAVARGADPSLLLDAQERLASERAELEDRLVTLETQHAALPDPARSFCEAEIARSELLRAHSGKNWRELSYEEVRQFLHHLFGQSTMKSGTGIFIEPGGQCQRRIRMKGEIDLGEFIGSAGLADAWERYSTLLAKLEAERPEIMREIARGMAMDESTPCTSNW